MNAERSNRVCVETNFHMLLNSNRISHRTTTTDTSSSCVLANAHAPVFTIYAGILLLLLDVIFASKVVH